MLDHAKRRLANEPVPDLGRAFREIVRNQNREDWWRRALRLLEAERLALQSYSAAPEVAAMNSHKKIGAVEDVGVDRCRHSSFVEYGLHLRFLAEMHQEAMRRGLRIAVFYPEVDDEGVDVLLRCKGIIRSVQEKCSVTKNGVGVNRELQEYPGGCVVMMSEGDHGHLRYSFLGNHHNEAGVDLSSYRSKRHTKANSGGIKTERPAIADVPRTKFARVAGIQELFGLLFG